MPFTYDYPRPAVCVDCVIFSEYSTHIILIQRAQEPFKDMWALPGGFVDMDETLMEAAKRELEEETSVRGIILEQLYTFGDPGRDPRGRVISVVYFGYLDDKKTNLQAGSDAANAVWWDINKLPQLAFDHQEIIAKAISIITR